MTTNARDLLLRAGWTPQRRVRVDDIVSRLLADDHDVVSPFRDVMAQFSGLAVTSEDGSQTLSFDMDEVLRRTDAGWCEAYGNEIGRLVTPVACERHMALLVDETGAFWGAIETQFGYMGDDIMQAIEWTLIEPPSAHPFDRRLPDD